jgi:hypothetical protein
MIIGPLADTLSIHRGGFVHTMRGTIDLVIHGVDVYIPDNTHTHASRANVETEVSE